MKMAFFIRFIFSATKNVPPSRNASTAAMKKASKTNQYRKTGITNKTEEVRSSNGKRGAEAPAGSTNGHVKEGESNGSCAHGFSCKESSNDSLLAYGTPAAILLFAVAGGRLEERKTTTSVSVTVPVESAVKPKQSWYSILFGRQDSSSVPPNLHVNVTIDSSSTRVSAVDPKTPW